MNSSIFVRGGVILLFALSPLCLMAQSSSEMQHECRQEARSANKLFSTLSPQQQKSEIDKCLLAKFKKRSAA